MRTDQPPEAALITGAASGIGAALSLRAAEAGYGVALIDIDEEGLGVVESSVRGLGVDVSAHVVDVTSPGDVSSAVEGAVRLHGALSLVCPNAGVTLPEAPLEALTDAQLDRVLSVNVKGVIHVLRASIPHLVDGGAVVLTSSVAGLKGSGGMAAYAASKIAMIGLGRSLAVELAPRRIRVNMVCPGGVDTALTRGAYGAAADDVISAYERQNPLGRIAYPDDIAEAMIFLGSARASHITGVALRVDGGDTLAGVL